MSGADFSRIKDPNRFEHHVYWLLNSRGRILYIGCTQNLPFRLSEHRRNGRFGDQWTEVATEGPYNYDTARCIERAHIFEHRPEFNNEWREGYNRSFGKRRVS